MGSSGHSVEQPPCDENLKTTDLKTGKSKDDYAIHQWHDVYDLTVANQEIKPDTPMNIRKAIGFVLKEMVYSTTIHNNPQ